ncbi:2891_t:CDS:1, partial [Scutellospora calospora]
SSHSKKHLVLMTLEQENMIENNVIRNPEDYDDFSDDKKLNEWTPTGEME